MMQNGGTLPFWVFFTPVAGEIAQMPYQNVCAPASRLFWTLSTNSTSTYSPQQWLEYCEAKPTSASLASTPQPASLADDKQDGSRKTLRAKKRRQRNTEKELESAKKNS